MWTDVLPNIRFKSACVELPSRVRPKQLIGVIRQDSRSLFDHQHRFSGRNSKSCDGHNASERHF